jgi:putative transposase
MNDLYACAQTTRQGHLQQLERDKAVERDMYIYIGVIEKARSFHPTMGLRTIYEQFDPKGIGRDKFVALGLEWGYRVKVHKAPHKTTYSVKTTRYINLLVDRCLTDVNQVWVSDIFYYPMVEGHYYVVLIMDLYTRRIVGYSVADNLRAENNLFALKMALKLRGVDNYKKKLIHHSDRGTQYICKEYTDLLKQSGILISMCNDVLENAHAERVNGTIKNAYLAAWNPKTPQELMTRLPQAVVNYNNRRHQALSMTPIDYEKQLSSINMADRQKLNVFTFKQNVENNTQLSLF